MPARFVGLDLGQVTDSTALAVVEHHSAMELAQAAEQKPGPLGKLAKAVGLARPGGLTPFRLIHLERLPLGTTYPRQVAHVVSLMNSRALAGRAELVVDATGVGRPVVDLLREAGLDPVAVSITGGDAVIADGRSFKVPKRDLVVALQVAIQNKQLTVARGLKEWPALEKELLAFKVKIDAVTAHDSYNARDGAHDDLVLAVALAVWRAKPGRPVHITGLGADSGGIASEADQRKALYHAMGLLTPEELEAQGLDQRTQEAAKERAKQVKLEEETAMMLAVQAELEKRRR